MGTKLLIVDGHAYAYRAFHAIRELRSPTGQPTNAIFGFTKMLGRMREKVKPSHLLVVWDGGLSSERVDLIPEYKAQRPAMPDALSDQIEQIIDFLKGVGVCSVRQEGVEADDIIAAWVKRATDAGGEVVIASSDKDFFQLVGPSVGLLNPADKSERIWHAEEVLAKTGVFPSQVVDWLSLVGDAVDNIPGVPGVGPKTAAELLGQFGSVKQLFLELEGVKSERLRSRLSAAKEDVLRNQEMIRLKDDLELDLALEELVPKMPDYVRCLELARHWGFKGMANEFQASLDKQGELFGVV